MKLAYQMPRLSLLWILASIVIIIAPQVLRLPWWVTTAALLCVVWRLAIFSGRTAFPSKTVRTIVVMLAVAFTTWQYAGVSLGLDAAICILALGVFFKTLEMRDKRDIAIVISLCYVLIMVGFIYSQTILSGLHALLAVTVCTGALISVSRDNSNNTLAHNGRLAARLVLQAIPLTIAFFILVPRIAPLWTMPTPAPSSTTGVSDEMSPGDISNLGRSSELAFRVTFNEGAPQHGQLYWRGLVLDSFDGRSWSRNRSSFGLARQIANEPIVAQVNTRGEAITYDIILEPTQQNWLYAISLADTNNPDIYRDRNFSLYVRSPITQRYRYDMRSYLQYESDTELGIYARRSNLALPQDDANTESREFAQSLRQRSASDRDYVQQVLRYFSEEPFFYTLTPSLLGQASVDEFLFSTREGFCEHYASSFVYLMRAAGVPARVVVGYQGGEYNPYEDYTMVYQYNAHAWSEVWLDGEGWVRIDPTAAVAPDRINLGVEAYFADQPGFLDDSSFSMLRFRNNEWINALRLRLDAVDYAWNRWVVSYDEDLQVTLFAEMFGEDSLKNLHWYLMGAVSLVFGVLAFFVLRGGKAPVHDRATQLYLAMSADLQKIGLGRERGEGPRDYAERVAIARPDLAEDIREATGLYVKLNYALTDSGPTIRAAHMSRYRECLRRLRSNAATGFDGMLMRALRKQ